MEKAILQKEWLKTRRVFIICLVLTAAMAVYAVLRMNRLIQLKGADHLWLIMLLKDNSFVDVTKWTPLLCGIIIALAQMLPEMAQKRLKLTLHLPYPQRRMVVIMLLTGMAELLILCILQSSLIIVYDATILPVQLVKSVFLTMVPWFIAGFVAYLFTSAICLEGLWSRRIVLSLVGIAFLLIFFEQTAMAAYAGIVLISLVFIAVLIILPLGSVIRFKEGLQD